MSLADERRLTKLKVVLADVGVRREPTDGRRCVSCMGNYFHSIRHHAPRFARGRVRILIVVGRL